MRARTRRPRIVMPHPSWNDSYASGHLPWDTGQPEALLVERCFTIMDRILQGLRGLIGMPADQLAGPPETGTS